ncbi:MAG: hypothetical protein PHQ70_06020 [Arcobacter sp.]|uniref:hypothetical protein n=1 Tax=Arcobacter sp. TaxID=1872629 RepID=UPI0025847B16|nr:hypothetical protein [Arcobacter sp.]MDD3008409.1 hypothetical protein [Arcobacter sp.]
MSLKTSSATCTEGQSLFPEPYINDNFSCTYNSATKAITCAQPENGFYDDDGELLCNEGYEDVAGTCRKSMENGYLNDNGNLECYEGFTNNGDYCVPSTPPNSCGDGYAKTGTNGLTGEDICYPASDGNGTADILENPLPPTPDVPVSGVQIDGNVTKTFKNENDKSTQYTSYWYIKHNIRRFLCSRTLAPLTIYRKIRYFFKNQKNDYLKVTQFLKNNQIHRLFENTTYSYMRFNYETGEIEDITVWQKNTDLILRNRIKQNETFKLEYKKKEHKKALSVFVNDFVKYVHSETLNKFVLLPVIPSKLKDYQLNNYYRILENTDIDSLDLIHFELVKNEMIKRGFLNQTPTNLNEFIKDFNFNPFMSSIEKVKFSRVYERDLNIPFAVHQNLF